MEACEAIRTQKSEACRAEYERCSGAGDRADVPDCYDQYSACADRADKDPAYDDCLCRVRGFPGYDPRTGLCNENDEPARSDPCTQAIPGFARTPLNDNGTPQQMECCRERDYDYCVGAGGDPASCLKDIMKCLTGPPN